MKTHTITIPEQDARDATVFINIKRAGVDRESTIFTAVFKEEEDGSLYIEVSEDSNQTECIANTYPDFFTRQGEAV